LAAAALYLHKRRGSVTLCHPGPPELFTAVQLSCYEMRDIHTENTRDKDNSSNRATDGCTEILDQFIGPFGRVECAMKQVGSQTQRARWLNGAPSNQTAQALGLGWLLPLLLCPGCSFFFTSLSWSRSLVIPPLSPKRGLPSSPYPTSVILLDSRAFAVLHSFCLALLQSLLIYCLFTQYTRTRTRPLSNHHTLIFNHRIRSRIASIASHLPWLYSKPEHPTPGGDTDIRAMAYSHHHHAHRHQSSRRDGGFQLPTGTQIMEGSKVLVARTECTNDSDPGCVKPTQVPTMAIVLGVV
jgi:hypothetical protein